jgi:hypothetical protein
VRAHAPECAPRAPRDRRRLAVCLALHATLFSCVSAPRSVAETAAAAEEARQIQADDNASRSAVAETLGEASAVRDNSRAPILAVMTIGSVVYPYVYGYPLHPEGNPASGIAQLRRDNHRGAHVSESADDAGVVHVSEDLPAIGCRIEGIREEVQKYVPVSLTCKLPAPKALGGSKRPVLGAVNAGAKADRVLDEPTVKENFFGAYHLTSDDFATGSGTAYFNTTHGQLALVFAHKKLAKFVYYFDPDVQAWQNPVHWVQP